MILFQGIVDGYDVKIQTTEMYDRGEILPDDDMPSTDFFIKGNGRDIKSPIWGTPPKVITDGMVRGFLRAKNLMPV